MRAVYTGRCAALSQLLQFPAPNEEGRTLACPWATSPLPRAAQQPVMTAVGPVEVLRLTIYAHHCGVGQFRWMSNWIIENTEFSPGVRRCGDGGPGGPLRSWREQMKSSGRLEVTTKSVERTAEAIGADIA